MRRSEHDWVDHIEGELRITAAELAGKERNTNQESWPKVRLIVLVLLVGYAAFVVYLFYGSSLCSGWPSAFPILG